MNHLYPARLVELAEGETPDRAAADHLAACNACRQEVASARQMITLAGEVDDPPVSPLMWEHFPARVREAIDREEPVAARRAVRWAWLRRPAFTTLAASIVVFVAVVVAWHLRPSPSRVVPERGTSPSIVSAQDGSDAFLPRDASWSLVAEAGAYLDSDATAELGFGVRPGSAERAVADLSQEEQAELARLLRAEIRQGS